MNVQTEIGHVIDVLAGDEPDDLANLAVGIMSLQARKCPRVNFLAHRQLADVIERGTFCLAEKQARAVLIERVEFCFVHRLLDHEGATDIHTESASVDLGNTLAYEEDKFTKQRQFLSSWPILP